MRGKDMRGVFDERQRLVRGTAYKWGFITLAASVLALIYGLEEGWFASPGVGAAIALMPGLGVFVCIAIHGGAYWWAGENIMASNAVLALAGGSNILAVAIGGDVLVGGRLGIGALHIAAAAALIAAAVFGVAAYLRDRRGEE